MDDFGRYYPKGNQNRKVYRRLPGAIPDRISANTGRVRVSRHIGTVRNSDSLPAPIPDQFQQTHVAFGFSRISVNVKNPDKKQVFFTRKRSFVD